MEEYELKEIFTHEQISQKRAKLCTVCARRVACCVWKSIVGCSSWKNSLDCQDDNFPDWQCEWNSFLAGSDISWSSDIIAKCSKNKCFVMPIFPLNLASGLTNPPDAEEMEGIILRDNLHESASSSSLPDETFLPHNDPIAPPNLTLCKRKTDLNESSSVSSPMKSTEKSADEKIIKGDAFMNLPATSEYYCTICACVVELFH